MSTAEGVRQDIRINFPVNFRRISKSWQTTGTKRRTARRKEIQLISARKIGSFFPREPSRHPSLLAFSSASPANPIDSSFFEQFAPNTDPRCYNSSMLLSNSLYYDKRLLNSKPVKFPKSSNTAIYGHDVSRMGYLKRFRSVSDA